MSTTTVIIPSLNPSNSLIEYVNQLISHGFTNIIVIDDGSSVDKQDIYTKLESFKECHVLHHAVNMGKGRALKNAFNYVLTHHQVLLESPDGVITVDCDGQHTVEDVLKLSEELKKQNSSLILGVRDFDIEGVPFKSRFGNKCTKSILRFFYGGNISDTQTGLRAIPTKLLPLYLTLFGERFEYETTMLIETLKQHIPIQEIKIRTVYINDNSETHFRPIADSWAIYKLILGTFIKYSLSAISSFLIDLLFFEIISFILKDVSLGIRVWGATIGARIISSLWNYSINKNIVFSNKESGKNIIVKYYSLCVIQMICSATLVFSLCQLTNLAELIAKLIVDTILFFVSFQIQRNWIFGRSKF